MDSKKIIKKYIMPGGFCRIGRILFSLVTVALLAMGIVTMNADSGEAVDFFPSETPVHTMAYIDVVGLSNWLYQTDDVVYYSVEDDQGFLYTVRLKDSQVREMSAQEEYWNREDDSAPMPAPYRLEGYVQETGTAVKESLAQSWDISVEDYEYIFGLNYLNATTSASAEKAAGWFLGALFAFLFALFCLLIYGRAASVAKKCLNHLEERNLLDRAAQQLENTAGHTVIGKNKAIFTQEFLFGKGTGAVLPYSEILWAYKQEVRRYGINVNCYLVAGTVYLKPQGVIDIPGADRKGYLGDALTLIAQRNPNAALGFTNENRVAYNAAFKAAK